MPKVGQKLPTRKPDKLTELHRSELWASGLSDETIDAAGIYSESNRDKLKEMLGWKWPPSASMGAAMVIPFIDLEGNNGYYRLKFEHPRLDPDRDDKPVKYESPKGQPNQIYLPPGVAAALADPQREIVLTEGEKKAIAATQEGFPCIGLVGVYGWKVGGEDQLLPELEEIAWASRRVNIVIDSDGATNSNVRKAADKLARLLTAKGAIVRVVILPSGADREKVGLDDYLLRNGPDALRELLNSATDNPPADERELEAQMVCLADVIPEQVEWLWSQRIAIGKLTLIVGVPGLGKSLITTYIAASTSIGGPWPPGFPRKRQAPGGVVLMSCEDDLADTIQPRLVAAKADLKRIHALVGAQYKDKDAEEISIDLKRHLDVIERAVQRTPDCRLLILDPISGYLAGIDSHKDGEVRPILAKLGALAAKYRIAIVAVAHMNKSDAQAAIHRASGSTAFVAAARAVWGVVEDREDESGKRRLLLPIKNNLGNDKTGLAYSIRKQGDDPAPSVKWFLEPVKTRIDDAMGVRSSKGPEPTKRNEAVAFLKVALASGRRPAKELFAEAKAAGIAAKTLKNAKKHLGVIASQEPNLGPWWWELPLAALVPDPSLPISASKPSKTTKPPKETSQKP